MSKKKMPDTNVRTDVDPGTGNKSRGRKTPLFEETPDVREIPNFGAERQDNVGTGPDSTVGRDGHNGPDSV